MNANEVDIEVDRNNIVLRISGGPQGPKGDPTASIVIKGVATSWPPIDAAHAKEGDLWVVSNPPPTGAPAWALPGHGAFWNGSIWQDAGLIQGTKGDKGEPGPPLNIRGTAAGWVPDSAPKGGDVWILPDPLPAGTPAGFKAGGAAAWDATAGVWIPLEAIRGPAGHSVTVYGPSPTPPVGVTLYKGDMWLASDPSLFSPSFDPSGIVPAPGPAGPPGPTGPSAYEAWKIAAGKPTASMGDFIASMKGVKGETGDKGDPGETLKVQGVVADEAALPAAPAPLTVNVTQDTGHLWIYDPTSPAAKPSGWVDLGKIAGPAGRSAHITASVPNVAALPARGTPGEMTLVIDTGHIWGWDDVQQLWVDGGRFGGSIPDGLAQGQMLVWDDTLKEWQPAAVDAFPKTQGDGTPLEQDDVLHYDIATTSWKAMSLDELTQANVELTNLHDVEIAGGMPLAGEMLAWDDVDGMWKNVTPSIFDLADVTIAPGGMTADPEVLTWDGVNQTWTNKVVTVPALRKLPDVQDVAATDGQLLSFDNASSKWAPLTPNYATRSYVDFRFEEMTIGLSHEVPVIDIMATPPTSPTEDEYYIVAVGGLGVWAGYDNEVAFYVKSSNGSLEWHFSTPRMNETHLVEAKAANYTWNGTAWVKVSSGSSAAPTAAGDLFMVGDVKQSWLTESQFTSLLPVGERGKWVLADGRDVTGTAFHTITGQTNVPDLRGAFLRAAGTNSTRTTWIGGTPRTYKEDSTALPNNDFTGVTNTTGRHTHSKGAGAVVKSDGAPNWPSGVDLGTTGEAGDHSHTVTLTGGGDPYTAPMHVAVNTFCKIN